MNAVEHNIQYVLKNPSPLHKSRYTIRIGLNTVEYSFSSPTIIDFNKMHIMDDITIQTIHIRNDDAYQRKCTYMLKNLNTFLKHYPNIIKFTIYNCYIPDFHENMFINNIKLKSIKIHDCNIKKLYKRQFSMLTELEEIEIVGNLIQKLHSNTFKNKTIKKLCIMDDHINKLTYQFIKSIHHISNIELQCYKIASDALIDIKSTIKIHIITNKLPIIISDTSLITIIQNIYTTYSGYELFCKSTKYYCKQFTKIIKDEMNELNTFG